MRPRRRVEGLLLRELAGELIVYDLEGHRAHCLNRAAALVFERSDGETSVRELARMLRRELGGAADEGWVELALAKLGEAGLLREGPEEPARRGAASSRREMLRRAGLASAAALPIVLSIVAPTPAMAAATCVVGNSGCSGKGFGTPCHCGTPTDCQGNCSCDGAGQCCVSGNCAIAACTGC